MSRALGLALLLIGLSGPAAAVEIAGQIRLLDEQQVVIREASEYRQAVVYFEPSESEVLADEREYVLTTRRRQFEPRVLVIPAGASVRFPNDDPILHNVFSSSDPNRFDLGLYGRGEGELHRFDSPGLVRVFCNVHPAMSAHIVVVNSPFFTRPDSDGRFRLDALPPGPGRLTLWHERARPVTLDLELNSEAALAPDAEQPLDQPIDLVLDVREIQPQRQRLPRRRGRY